MASHKLNISSSRSHTILTINVDCMSHGNPESYVQSSLKLVDLAGSERHNLIGGSGKLSKESIDINKSLFTLRQVISALTESSTKENAFIPYRESKLTSLLW